MVMRPRRMYQAPPREPQLLSDAPARCRLCLSRSDALTPILHDDNSSPLSLVSHIHATLNIEIVNDERLPTKICELCKSEVERYYKFRRKCEVAEKKLQLHMRLVGLMFGPESPTKNTLQDKNKTNTLCPPITTSTEEEEEKGLVLDKRVQTAEEQLRSLVRAALLVNGAPVSARDTISFRPEQEYPQLEVSTQDGSLFTMQICEEDESEELDLPLTVSLPADPTIRPICPKCQETFSDQVSLAEHMVQHTRVHKCFQCSKYFLSASNLHRHQRTHTGERPYTCDDCGKCFAQKEILSRHSLVHLDSDKRPHQCKMCEKSYTQLGTLEAHKLTHEPPGSRPLHLMRCDLCPKVFCYASGLSRHMKSHSATKFECSECSKRYTDKSTLQRHIRVVHTRRHKPESPRGDAVDDPLVL